MYIKIKLLIIVSWKATIIYYMNIGQLSIVQNPLANIFQNSSAISCQRRIGRVAGQESPCGLFPFAVLQLFVAVFHERHFG